MNQSLHLEPPSGASGSLPHHSHHSLFPTLLFGYSGNLLPILSNHLNWAGGGKAAHPPTHSHQSPQSRAEGAAGHHARAATFFLEPEAVFSTELVSCSGKAGSWLGRKAPWGGPMSCGSHPCCQVPEHSPTWPQGWGQNVWKVLKPHSHPENSGFHSQHLEFQVRTG